MPSEMQKLSPGMRARIGNIDKNVLESLDNFKSSSRRNIINQVGYGALGYASAVIV